MMTRLLPEEYLAHVRRESARFRDVIAAGDPAARVPGCPDWDAGDLLWHLCTVQEWWGSRLLERPAAPAEDALASREERPADQAALLARFDAASARMLAAMEGADPAEPAWTWSAEQTVGFILRRQAHEALIHRLDAEQAAGSVTPLDPVLAADGVEEVLDVMYGGCPPWGSWEPLPHLLRVDCTDTGDRVWVRLGLFSGTDPDTGETITDEEDCHVVAAPEDPDLEPDVVIDAPAGLLDAWLWDRATDEGISVAGDRAVHERFRSVVGHPIT